ncbi:MAG: GDP-L-fucose synthase [Candidatus Azotimanducaceae bacterium]|jgi:GDP-L-fucose synthase
MLSRTKKIFVSGHNGLVGSALVRALKSDGYENLLVASRSDLDLTRQGKVEAYLQEEKPDVVIVAAGKVGGIHANNTYPAEFIYENLMMETNLIHGSYASGCSRLLFLGSSCIYPRLAAQPIAESELLAGPLEPTNEAYAIAKIAGIKMCESYNRQYAVDFRSVMPTNLYGPGEDYHPENSHVIPGLIQRFHAAKVASDSSVTVWGTGNAKREFLYVDDLARACLEVLKLDREAYREVTSEMVSHINLGAGYDISIREVAEAVKQAVGFEGDLVFDVSKPDGMPRKLLEVSAMKSLGIEPSFSLDEGLAITYRAYLEKIMT